MAPKAATKSEGASKAKASSSGHASYQDMIKEAIVSLKNRNGSSRQALKKYVKANNAHLKDVQDSMFDSLFNRALKNGVEKGVFEQPKGPSGGTKLAKPAAAAAKKEAAPKKEGEEKKPAAKKATTAKKPAAKKAAAPKKETAKKDVPKKAAAKKAAPKKTAPKKAAAPKKADAVVDKPAVLTKTKSGRVAKSTAPKPAAKKAAPKKAAAKKATPKKAEAASA